MGEIPVYSGSIGINNKVPTHRLSYSSETGVGALEDCKNFIVDQTGELVTRRGTERVGSGVFHSLFPVYGMIGLVASDRSADTAIFRVEVSDHGDVTLSGIRSGLDKGRRIDWCVVGGKVFYVNGRQNGVLVDECSASRPWVESMHEVRETTRGFMAPNIGEHLCFLSGRIYLSRMDRDRPVLEYTEYGKLGLFDPATNVEVFDSRILMLIPAADGLYVSTETAVYFLAGLNPKEWTARMVLEYPVVEWCKWHHPVDPSHFGFQANTPSFIAGTMNGPVVFLPSGTVVNLIDKNIKTQGCAKEGGIAVFDESLIIQTGVQ